MSFLHLFQTDPPVNPDFRDEEDARNRVALRDKIGGARVGDFLKFSDGHYERFCHEWDDGLQTSLSGSYYLHTNGYVSMSGACNPVVKHEMIEPTDSTITGDFWMFHHDICTAHNAVGIAVKCRLFFGRRWNK